MAVISETHFKCKHTEDIIHIDGYNIFRRDRLRRRAGGVAIILDAQWSYCILEFPQDNRDFELMWIRCDRDGRKWIIGAIYHPPRPIYKTEALMKFLEQSTEDLMGKFPDHNFVLGGDINQLPTNEVMERTGLKPINMLPSRGLNVLDNVFVSNFGDYKIKVVKSTIKSDHSALVVFSGEQVMVNKNKQSKVVNFRKKSPSINARSLASMDDQSFSDVMEMDDVQTATDMLYSVATSLLNTHYPIKRITVTNKDPSFMTGELKEMLRRKNKLSKVSNNQTLATP